MMVGGREIWFSCIHPFRITYCALHVQSYIRTQVCARIQCRMHFAGVLFYNCLLFCLPFFFLFFVFSPSFVSIFLELHFVDGCSTLVHSFSILIMSKRDLPCMLAHRQCIFLKWTRRDSFRCVFSFRFFSFHSTYLSFEQTLM